MVLVLAMVFSAMLGVMSFAEDAGALSISMANLEFADNVYLLIAVDYSAVGSADGITLKIKNNKTGDETTIDAPAADIKDVPAGCVAFKYDDIGAKNMGDELTIQAYLNGSASGDPINYSILEYALRAESLADEKLTALVKYMIKYGAEAQKAWGHEGTYDLSVDHSLVKLKGGATFADGTTKAIMKAGDSLTATKLNADEAWFNTAAHKFGSANTLTINYSEDNQTYFTAPESELFGGSSNFYFNMNDYTGATTTYEYAKKSAAPAGEPYFNGTYVGISCSAIINTGYDITVTPGYMKLRGNVSLNGMSNTAWQNAVKEVAASDDKVFTLSITVATDAAATSGAFANWYLRRGHNEAFDTIYEYSKSKGYVSKGTNSTHVISKNTYYMMESEDNYVLKTYPQYGRVSLLTNDGAKSIINYYNSEGKKSSTPGKIATPSSISTTEPGAFVTMHIVFDLDALTMTYYLGDDATPICTSALPVDVDYLCGSYLEHFGGGNYTAYLKSVVVTKCDLTEYFK